MSILKIICLSYVIINLKEVNILKSKYLKNSHSEVSSESSPMPQFGSLLHFKSGEMQ